MYEPRPSDISLPPTQQIDVTVPQPNVAARATPPLTSGAAGLTTADSRR